MNSDPIQTILDEHGVVVIDGALATELEHRGADLNDPLWSAKLLVEDPALIHAVHMDYLRAGADVVITASYQASFPGFMRRGLSESEAAKLMELSVELACAARACFWEDPANRTGRARPLVAASIGPYGAYLADGSEYRGLYDRSVAELVEFHRPRMRVLAAAGADLFACETIPCQAEGEALVQLLDEFPQMPAWLSFSCRDGAHLSSGEPFANAAALANRSAQIVAVGINCTAPRYIEELLATGCSVTGKPLLCYPNSGERWDAANHCWVGGTGVTDFAEPSRRWYAAGARLIGGCCRTGPDDIRTIASALRRR